MSWKIILPGFTLLLIFSSFLIIRSNLFTIKSVDVSSEKVGCTDNEHIKNSSDLFGQNFFLINFSKLYYDLKKQFICIKNVTVKRQLPDRVKLFVFGREAAAILVELNSKQASLSGELEASNSASFNFSASDQTESFMIDSEGVIYSKNIEQINIPKIYISDLNLDVGQKLNEDYINNTLKILEKVKSFGIDFKEAEIYSERFLLISAAPKIIFKLDELDAQIASLQLILNSSKIDNTSLEFIDLRFDKPVVRLAPKK